VAVSSGVGWLPGRGSLGAPVTVTSGSAGVGRHAVSGVSVPPDRRLSVPGLVIVGSVQGWRRLL
jgi:hypothetical protein